MFRPLGQTRAQAVGVHEQVDLHPNTAGPVIAKQTTHRKRARGPSGTAPSPWVVVVCLGIGGLRLAGEANYPSPGHDVCRDNARPTNGR